MNSFFNRVSHFGTQEQGLVSKAIRGRRQRWTFPEFRVGPKNRHKSLICKEGVALLGVPRVNLTHVCAKKEE